MQSLVSGSGVRCGASLPSCSPRITLSFSTVASPRAHGQLIPRGNYLSSRLLVAAPLKTSSTRNRSVLRVAAGRLGGKRDDFRRRDGKRFGSDEGELKDALAILQREWPKLILPGIGILIATSLLGPMIFGATFMALAAAGTMAAFAAPMFFIMGAGMLAGGAGVVAAVGLTGMYLLKAILGMALSVGLAVLGAKWVMKNVLGDSKRSSSTTARGAAGTTMDADYDDWTGGDSRRSGEVDRDIEKELERMRRDAVDDLRSFDEVLRAKERFRRGPPPRS